MTSMTNHFEPKLIQSNTGNDFTFQGSKNEYLKFNPNNSFNKNNINISKNFKNIESKTNNNYNNDNIRKYFTFNNDILQRINANLDKKHKNIKKTNNNIFSTINEYWEKRKKENKIKMDKIKMEREKKIYGNIYPIPKISKNSKEIIKRKENIAAKFFEEDQINKNIPIKTEQKNIYFKNNYIKGNINKINEYSKYDYKDSYVRLMLLKKVKKRTITPKPKNVNKLKRKRIENHFIKRNSNEFNITEIKSLDKINRLRKKQEKERFQNMQNLTENNIETFEKIFRNKNSNKGINNNISRINDNNKNFFTLESLNTKIKLLSQRIKSYESSTEKSISLNNDNTNLNKTEEFKNEMNYIMRPRIHLNEIYNKDKRIINHSSLESKSNRTLTTQNIPPKIKIYHKKQISGTKSFPNLSKINNLINAVSKKIKNKRNENANYSKSKNYTEKTFSNFTNNNSLSYYNLLKNKTSYEKSHQFYKMSKNNNINKINYLNKYNPSSSDNFLKEKNNIDGGDSKNSENLENIILKNESINKIFNELDNDSLTKYRQENEQKIIELNKNKKIKKINRKYLKLNLVKQIEESKNHFNQFDENIYRTIDNQNIKNILSSQHIKMENSLDYYNKELELNNKKKKIFLEQFYEKQNNKTNYYENEKTNNNNNKYNKRFEYDYNRYKMNKDNDEMLDYENNDIIGYFKFERKLKF